MQVNKYLKIMLAFIYHEIRRMAQNLLVTLRRSASLPHHGIIRNPNKFRKTLFQALHSSRAPGLHQAPRTASRRGSQRPREREDARRSNTQAYSHPLRDGSRSDPERKLDAALGRALVLDFNSCTRRANGLKCGV